MDEKVFQRIIPFIIAVAVLIVQYVIRNQKKKNESASSTNKVPEFEEIVFEKETVKPVFEKVQATKKDHLPKIVKERDSKDNSTEFTRITYQTVKQTMKQNMKQNIKPSVNITEPEKKEKSMFTFTDEELKKAIIYSEILTPKHF